MDEKRLSTPYLLSIKHLSTQDIDLLLARGAFHLAQLQDKPQVLQTEVLRGRTVVNLFFEPSTRTELSYELAAKRLGAYTLNVNMDQSSMTKGETVLDTAVTVHAMQADVLVVRHKNNFVPASLAQNLPCSIVNAGDGTNEHPSQALLDALTLRTHFGALSGLRIAICGDILHSRVARSNIMLLKRLGCEVRLIAPSALLPLFTESTQDKDQVGFDLSGVEVFHDIQKGLANCDVVMMLRLQTERMLAGTIPSKQEYFRQYGLDSTRLAFAKPGAMVMHPGPINRGVEICSTVVDNPEKSLINSQVTCGVAMRMAILEAVIGGQNTKRSF